MPRMPWSIFFMAPLRIYSAALLTNRNSSQLLFFWWLLTVKSFRCFEIHFHVFLWVSQQWIFIQNFALPVSCSTWVCQSSCHSVNNCCLQCAFISFASLNQLGSKRREELMQVVHKLHEWYLNTVSRHLWRINSEKHFPQSLFYSELEISNTLCKQWSGRRKWLGFTSQLLTQWERKPIWCFRHSQYSCFSCSWYTS